MEKLLGLINIKHVVRGINIQCTYNVYFSTYLFQKRQKITKKILNSKITITICIFVGMQSILNGHCEVKKQVLNVDIKDF